MQLKKKIREQLTQLDLKDKKLLFALDFNARLPYSSLAKKIGMSKQGIEYKLKALQAKGVITGFYPVIDPHKLGYLYCRLALTLQNATQDKRLEISTFLQKDSRVFWLFEMQGIYDIFMGLWLPSLTAFKQFIDELLASYGDLIKAKIESVGVDVIHYQHRYLLGLKQTEEIHLQETAPHMKIDSIDQQILKQLCTNARFPVITIARSVKQSASVVAYRIRRMEAAKLILGYRPIINHNRIGYTYYKLFVKLNNFSPEALRSIKSYLRSSPLVIYLVEALGWQADLDIELMTSSNQQLFDFINDLRFKFPAIVGDYQTVVFTKTLKVRYLPSG
ncbi:Lrp/AsnC family transcriptional regulator [Candidatus Woesearchaeota archaeon]|nr:Lrp/AsnC family transcriptional regulator [Candidatus Woesearchaeota archaeon]